MTTSPATEARERAVTAEVAIRDLLDALDGLDTLDFDHARRHAKTALRALVSADRNLLTAEAFEVAALYDSMRRHPAGKGLS